MKTISDTIISNGIKIHFERTSNGKPPLIMCHGVTDNGRCMLRLAGHLSSQFDVVLMDARGHGLSEAPEIGYSADHHADDIKGLIDALGLIAPILYGHSMGARTATRFAAKYPHVPRAVILEDPVYLVPPDERDLRDRDIWLENMRADIIRWKKMSFEEHFQNARNQGHKDWTEDEQIEWAKSRFQVSPNVFDMGGSMEEITRDFPKIQCPVLILKADAAEDIRKKEREAAASIPNGKIIHITGAGHNIRREDYAATTRHIDEFIKGLP